MTSMVGRALFPFALVVAAALWARGYAASGDGFSASAVAGLSAVIQYVCLEHERADRIVGARFAWRLVVLGLLLVLATILTPLLVGEPPVTHFPAPGAKVHKLGVLELHTALVFDAGVALVVYGCLVGTFSRLFPWFRGVEP